MGQLFLIRMKMRPWTAAQVMKIAMAQRRNSSGRLSWLVELVLAFLLVAMVTVVGSGDSVGAMAAVLATLKPQLS